MWLIIGLLLGVGIAALAMGLSRRRIVVRWYEFLLGGIGAVLLLWTIHDFFASFAEHNNIAAWTFLWLLGAPALILLGVSCLFPWRRHRRTIQ